MVEDDRGLEVLPFLEVASVADFDGMVFVPVQTHKSDEVLGLMIHHVGNGIIFLFDPDGDLLQFRHGLLRDVSVDEVELVVEESQDSIGEGPLALEGRGDIDSPASDLPLLIS